MKTTKDTQKHEGKTGKSKKNLQCEICKSILKSEYYLKKHNESRHPDHPRTFICDYDGNIAHLNIIIHSNI